MTPKKLANAYVELLIRRPGSLLLLLFVLAVLSAYGVSQLHINTNQLELMSPELQEIQDLKRVVDMGGGEQGTYLSVCDRTMKNS